MLYDSDMERRLSSRGYSVRVFGDMTAMIFYKGRFVDKVCVNGACIIGCATGKCLRTISPLIILRCLNI